MENIINSCIKLQDNNYIGNKYWDFFYSRENILGFLDKNNYNNLDVCNKYKEAIKYRKQLYNLTHKCEKCIINPDAHSMKIIEDRCILIEPAKALDNDSFYICKHFSILIDKITNKRNFEGVNSITIIIDYEDYSIYDMVSNMNIVYELITMIRKCYDHLIYKYIIINPPLCITPVINTIKTMMDDNMINKLEIKTV